MAKRCEDEFNPWPSFVDIFSSVILVMLLFLLVVLVNLGYYAQFKYKVSYTGSIATDDLILNDNPSEAKKKEDINQEQKDSQSQSQAQEQKIQQLQQEIIRIRKTIEQRLVKAKEEKHAELEAGGIDVKDVKDDDNESKQVIYESDDYFIVTFKSNEIFFDNAITKKLKLFIDSMKSKYKNHQILITAADVKGRASATVAKQISLARSIGARNLIRKLGYKKKDVRIDLLASTKIKEKVNEENGYLVIRVRR